MNTRRVTNGKPVVRWYRAIVDEEDARVCRDIPEEACEFVPRNFFVILVSNSLTKLGDAIANPKTVLAWLIGIVGAPAFLVGFLVPVREAGSLVPQLAVAAMIRRVPIRKWVWTGGAVVQAGAVAGMGVAALSLRGALAGWTIIAALVVFSLARGVCSVASKDVLGKTIPKTRRGRLGGLAASISSAVAVLVGFWLTRAHDVDQPATLYGWLLIGAAVCWALAAGVFASIQERSGATSGGGNALRKAVARVGLLRTDRTLRNFVIVRALMLSSALSAPTTLRSPNRRLEPTSCFSEHSSSRTAPRCR